MNARYGLLPDVEVQEPADLTLRVHLHGAFLEEPDQHHRPVHLEDIGLFEDLRLLDCHYPLSFLVVSANRLPNARAMLNSTSVGLPSMPDTDEGP